MKKIRKLTPMPKAIQRSLLAKYYSITKVQQQAIQRITQANFYPNLAVTLTFTQCPFDGNVNTFNKQQINKQYKFCDDKIKQLMCRLNQDYRGSHWHDKMLKDKRNVIQVFVATEISKNNLFHLHLAFETPVTSPKLSKQKSTKQDFEQCITQHWNSLGMIKRLTDPNDDKQPKKVTPQIKFRDITDNGWVEYITKDLHKDNGLGYCEYSNFS